jgi:hypothetical protein
MKSNPPEPELGAGSPRPLRSDSIHQLRIITNFKQTSKQCNNQKISYRPIFQEQKEKFDGEMTGALETVHHPTTPSSPMMRQLLSHARRNRKEERLPNGWCTHDMREKRQKSNFAPTPKNKKE